MGQPRVFRTSRKRVLLSAEQAKLLDELFVRGAEPLEVARELGISHEAARAQVQRLSRRSRLAKEAREEVKGKDRFWNDERLKLLISEHAAGSSSGYIAGVLGVTRNVVIGKIHRLGLAKPAQSGLVEKRFLKREFKPKPNPIFRFGQPEAAGDAIKDVVAKRPPEVETERHPQEHRCDLMGLTNATCRYPVGEVGSPEFFFCGRPEADLAGKRPYCEECTREALNGIPAHARRPPVVRTGYPSSWSS